MKTVWSAGLAIEPPEIQCQPGPSDADLEAERDAKHALVMAEWFARNEWAGRP